MSQDSVDNEWSADWRSSATSESDHDGVIDCDLRHKQLTENVVEVVGMS